MAIFKRKTNKTNSNTITNTKTSSSSSSSSSTSSSTSLLKTSKPTTKSKSLFRKIWVKKSKKPQRITATCKPQWEWSNAESVDWLTKVLIHYCNQFPSRALENARSFMSSKDLSQGGREIEEKKKDDKGGGEGGDNDEVEEEEEKEKQKKVVEEVEEENKEELDGKYLFSATPEEWAAKLGPDDGKKVFCLIFHWRNEKGGVPEGVSFPHFEGEENSSYS